MLVKIEINEWSLTNAKSALQQYLKLLQKNVDALIIDNEINVIILIRTAVGIMTRLFTSPTYNMGLVRRGRHRINLQAPLLKFFNRGGK